jgi:O-antigen/teichoic acid export membrane protein
LTIVSAVRDQIQRHIIIKHIVNLVSASVLGRAIQFGTTIAVAAWLTPYEIGLWPLFLALTQIPMVLGVMRLDIAITLAKSPDAARGLCSIATIMTFLIALTTAIATQIFPQLVEYYFQIEIKIGLAVLVFFYILAMNLMNIYQAWLIRTHQFQFVARYSIIYPVLTLLICLLMQATGHLDGTSFIFANIAGYCVGMAYLLIVTKDMPIGGLLFSAHGWRERYRHFVEYKSYPLLYTPYSLSQGVQEKAIQLILGGIYGIASLGQFFIARQLLQGSAALIAQPIRQIIFARYASQSNSPDELLQLSKIMGVIAAVTAPLTLLVGTIGAQWITALLGDKWADAQSIFFWMVWVAWATVSVSWIDRLFDVAWRQKLAVGLQIVSDLIILGAAIFLANTGSPFAVYVAVYAILTTAYNFLWSVVALRVAGLSNLMASIPLAMGVIGLAITLSINYLISLFFKHDSVIAHFLTCCAALIMISISIWAVSRSGLSLMSNTKVIGSAYE